MPLYHIFILALIQGITEFLPISSSGHLVLAHGFLDGTLEDISWQSQDIVLDVAVHLGTLLSVLIYFRRDVGAMAAGCVRGVVRQDIDDGGRMALFVVIASLPVIAAGFVLHIIGPDWVRSAYMVAWMTLIFGVLLWVADRFFPQDKVVEDMRLSNALWIGAAQILALIPGVSRSGITMTAARFCGFSRAESAKFSLFLAIVAIAGAGTLSGIDLWRMGDVSLGIDALLAAMLAFLSGWAAIAVMMEWLKKSSFLPFVLYRIGLGVTLLVILHMTNL